MSNLKNVVYLTNADYSTLISTGTVTVGDVVLNYDPADIYVVPDDSYVKPATGIPSTDMTSAVQTSLGKADTAYQKPASGIPASDLASGVIPDVTGKENASNKTTSLSSSSTDTQYPSSKCVYDELQIEMSAAEIETIWDGVS